MGGGGGGGGGWGGSLDVINFGTKSFHLSRLGDFLSFSLPFSHFLTSQTLIEDDNSRDAWLNPLILKEEGNWAKVLR